MADIPEIVSAYTAFGTPPNGAFWTIAEVEERVPLMYCHGGPNGGWVYDLRDMKEAPPPDESQVLPPESITYEYMGEIARMADGRIVRIYYPEPAAHPETSQ